MDSRNDKNKKVVNNNGLAKTGNSYLDPEKVEAIRWANVLTVKQTAELLEVHEETYRNWEKGRTAISDKNLQKLLELFQIPAFDLLFAHQRIASARAFYSEMQVAKADKEGDDDDKEKWRERAYQDEKRAALAMRMLPSNINIYTEDAKESQESHEAISEVNPSVKEILKGNG